MGLTAMEKLLFSACVVPQASPPLKREQAGGGYKLTGLQGKPKTFP